MSVEAQKREFAKSGFDGPDVRHIGVYVYPCADLIDGRLAPSFKIQIGEDLGSFNVDYPTKFIFKSMTKDWAFEKFAVDGQDWPGIYIYPCPKGFKIEFADDDKKVVTVMDDCKDARWHGYQIYLVNTKTGEQAITDPMIKNSDRQDGGNN